jgi:hypothetical protein
MMAAAAGVWTGLHFRFYIMKSCGTALAHRSPGDIHVFMHMAGHDPIEQMERIPRWNLQHGVC